MTQRHYFGTDGVRGRVGQPPITPELILKLGWAAGRTLAAGDGSRRGERPGVLIGKDTRISGYLLEAALESGFSAAGVDVYLCGPLPTPGVAALSKIGPVDMLRLYREIKAAAAEFAKTYGDEKSQAILSRM